MFPSLILAKSNTAYNQQKMETDFRQEDGLNTGGVLQGCNGLIECLGAWQWCFSCGSGRGWHPPGGWSSRTLQLPAEPWPCAPGSTGHTFQSLGQFCGQDARRSACIWGAQCSSETHRSHRGLLSQLVLPGLFSMPALRTPWRTCLPLSAWVSFRLVPPLLALMVLPLVPAVWLGMILVIAPPLPAFLPHHSFSLFCLG